MLLPWNIIGYATHWAVARYIWSFLPPLTAPKSKLTQSPYADDVRSRQRGIWTEDIGIGLAQKLLRASLGPGDFATPLLDSDLWLEPQVSAGQVILTKPKSRPDFISFRWLAASGPELLFVECKGRTDDRDGLADALCDGVRQLDNVVHAFLPVRRWAVGAGLKRAVGTWEALAVEVDEEQTPAATPTGIPDESSFEELVDTTEVTQSLMVLGDFPRAAEVAGREALSQDSSPPPLELRSSAGDQYLGRTLRLSVAGGTLSIYFGIDAQRAYADRNTSREKRRATRDAGPRVRELLLDSGERAYTSDAGTLLSVQLG